MKMPILDKKLFLHFVVKVYPTKVYVIIIRFVKLNFMNLSKETAISKFHTNMIMVSEG